MSLPALSFKLNPSIVGREDRYVEITVATSAILKSWKTSLYSFEWLLPDGTIRSVDDLPLAERDKRLSVEQAVHKNEALPKPVLGIGMLDNVEIGSGRDVFLTLAAMGAAQIPVYAPKSCEKEFKKFIIA